MIAEIYGKATGCCKGKGGSMHLIDQSVGFMGSTAIVGNSIPIGAGLGLSLKIKKSKNISCVFIGDGAIEEGVFAETINFCAQRNLPVLFICENNLYSVYSHLRVRQPEGREIFKMIDSMGVKSLKSDGNDVFKSYEIIKRASSSIRKNGGPRFIEFDTYRWREHCGPNYDNDIGYRSEEEFLQWKKKDPILNAEKKLKRLKYISDDEILKITRQAQIKVNRAFKFADDSPFPKKNEALQDIFS